MPGGIDCVARQLRNLRSGLRCVPLRAGFGPSFRGDLGDLAGGHLRQTGEHFTQVGQRIEAAPPAALDDGVEDGSAFSGLSFANEEPVFLAEGGGADGVLDPVIVDGDAAVAQEGFERGPLLKGVGDGFSQRALRQIPRADAPQRGAQPTQDHRALRGAHGLAARRSGVCFAQLVFDVVE